MSLGVRLGVIGAVCVGIYPCACSRVVDRSFGRAVERGAVWEGGSSEMSQKGGSQGKGPEVTSGEFFKSSGPTGTWFFGCCLG